jgi:hypothetical protein
MGYSPIREHGDLRAVRSMDGVSGDAVDGYVLYISDILHPEMRKLSGGHMPNSFDLVHLSSSFKLR